MHYGHKLNLASGKSGMILDVVIEAGNPADAERLLPMLERHIDIYGRPPRQMAADGGYASGGNLKAAKEKGVRDMAFHKKRGLKIEDMVRSRWVYRKLRNFRAGIEAGISCLKRAYGLARCTWKGLAHFKAYVWSSVVACPARGQPGALRTPQAGIARLTTARDTRPGGARRLTMSGSCPGRRRQPPPTIMSRKSCHLETKSRTNPAPAACGQPKTPAKHPVYGRTLARLDKPVEIVGVFKPGVTSALGAYSQNLLAEYRIHSDRLSVRTIDPDLSPDQARHYGVDQFGALLGAVVFTGEAGRKLVFGPQIAGAAEHAFTAAILEVTGVKQKKVYFLTGHGEHGITADYDSARRGLRDNLYQVAELDLLTGAGIPEDAAVVVLAGPRRPLVAGELRVLKDHLAADGRLLVLLDPGAPESLRRLLSEWWLDIEPGRIVDPSSHVAPKVDSPLVDRTGNSFGLAQVYFPGATALLPRDEVPDGVELSALAWSSPDSWLETSFASGAAPRRDEQTDRKGPLAIGALVSTTPAGTPDTSKGARLAVIGDSDFAANPHFHNGNNGELFLATVNWLAAGTQIIAVDRKALAVRRLLLSPAQARFLHVSAIGLLPLLLLLAAGALWWPGSRS